MGANPVETAPSGINNRTWRAAYFEFTRTRLQGFYPVRDLS